MFIRIFRKHSLNCFIKHDWNCIFCYSFVRITINRDWKVFPSLIETVGLRNMKNSCLLSMSWGTCSFTVSCFIGLAFGYVHLIMEGMSVGLPSLHACPQPKCENTHQHAKLATQRLSIMMVILNGDITSWWYNHKHVHGAFIKALHFKLCCYIILNFHSGYWILMAFKLF